MTNSDVKIIKTEIYGKAAQILLGCIVSSLLSEIFVSKHTFRVGKNWRTEWKHFLYTDLLPTGEVILAFAKPLVYSLDEEPYYEYDKKYIFEDLYKFVKEYHGDAKRRLCLTWYLCNKDLNEAKRLFGEDVCEIIMHGPNDPFTQSKLEMNIVDDDDDHEDGLRKLEKAYYFK